MTGAKAHEAPPALLMAGLRKRQMRGTARRHTFVHEGGLILGVAPMAEQTLHDPDEKSHAAEALRLLELAWSYYMPGSLPEPVESAFDEIPAAA